MSHNTHVRVRNHTRVQRQIPGRAGIKVDPFQESARIHVNCVDVALLEKCAGLTFYFADEDGNPCQPRVESAIEQAVEVKEEQVTVTPEPEAHKAVDVGEPLLDVTISPPAEEAPVTVHEAPSEAVSPQPTVKNKRRVKKI